MDIIIDEMRAPDADVRLLIGELEEDLSSHYAPHQRHGLALEAIFQPYIRFFLARRGAEALGCGGVALYPDFAEVKRMYVRSLARGQGIADALMDHLAAVARESGRNLLRLETGDRQQVALRFYARQGFRTCGAFAPYSSMPPEAIATSVFMERKL
jgi:putative acetyltransferase